MTVYKTGGGDGEKRFWDCIVLDIAKNLHPEGWKEDSLHCCKVQNMVVVPDMLNFYMQGIWVFLHVQYSFIQISTYS